VEDAERITLRQHLAEFLASGRVVLEGDTYRTLRG
jgi:hypothetical protein